MKSLKNNAGQSSSSSKILEKLWHVFVMSSFTRRRRLANQNKQICCQFCCQFFKNFRWRRALSSIVFQWFHVAKCYSELKNEELLLKQLPLKFFGEFSYCTCHFWQEILLFLCVKSRIIGTIYMISNGTYGSFIQPPFRLLQVYIL